MLVGDLIYNDEFDINCNFEVYSYQWNDGGKLLWSTIKDGYSKPPCALLDRKISYITVDVENYAIIIEVV